MKRVLVCGFVVSLMLYIGCKRAADTGPNKKVIAQSLVHTVAERLSQEKEENGALKIYQGLEEKDPWGNQLILKYIDSLYYERTVQVRSAGPDGLPYTDDDITANISVVRGIPVGLSEKTTHGIFRGATKGLREGLK